ncbi:MAG: peroxidase family protein [Verrucomicrobiales bacterium]|nr:peroxidase family protein [Verrucomicrobiales bacterium]
MKLFLLQPLIARHYLLVVLSLSFFPGSAFSQDASRGPSPNDLRKSERRGAQSSGKNHQKPGSVKMGLRSIRFPEEFRTIDGFGNNEANPEWGAAEVPFLRKTTIDYADGVDSPSGADRPNAREISNAICAQEGSILNRHFASDFLGQWGQFLDHDITLTPTSDLIEPFNIAVPAGDPWFDPGGTGEAEIDMDRSYSEAVDGVRQQINDITAFIDASNVYGSDSVRSLALRVDDESGRLLVSEGNLLPFNTEGLPNAPSDHATNFFLAGDFRANEQVGLTSLHTVFLREHNHWADAIARANENLTGDQIYEVARSIVGAEMQVITFREFLPRLLGPGALPRYRGYREDLNPGIANVFATASYRFGHSMLSPQLLRLDRRLREIEEGHLPLASAFFDPDRITDEGGIDPILRGLARQPAQAINTRLVDDMRNFLFGPPGAGGFDLAALNIQRGRDHGLPGYNEVRRNYGLDPVRDFDEITPDEDLQDALEETYGSVEAIDVWAGGLAERPLRGAMVGETVHAVLRDQFLRLRDGDRFWYQNHLDPELQRLIEQQTLARIIRRNTEISRELPEDLWTVDRREVRDSDRDRHSSHPPLRGPGAGRR